MSGFLTLIMNLFGFDAPPPQNRHETDGRKEKIFDTVQYSEIQYKWIDPLELVLILPNPLVKAHSTCIYYNTS